MGVLTEGVANREGLQRLWSEQFSIGVPRYVLLPAASIQLVVLHRSLHASLPICRT